MDIDPQETVAQATEAKEKSKSRLNVVVAITVALLATFMGICKVKDDNIVQAMQQAQADKLDHWAFYQARNIRQDIAEATVAQLRLAQSGKSPGMAQAYDAEISRYKELATEQAAKKEGLRKQAEQDQRQYDALNFHEVDIAHPKYEGIDPNNPLEKIRKERVKRRSEILMSMSQHKQDMPPPVLAKTYATATDYMFSQALRYLQHKEIDQKQGQSSPYNVHTLCGGL